MKIVLIYPDDLGKETEDEIIEWMMEILKNPAYLSSRAVSPLKYISDMEIER